MVNYKNIFIDYLLSQGIRFEDIDEYVISIGFNARNLSPVKIYVYFDQDGEGMVHFSSEDLEKFQDQLRGRGIVTCNTLNNRLRWAKFKLDREQDIIVEADAFVTPESCGFICLQMVKRLASIIDEAYPEIERARWA